MRVTGRAWPGGWLTEETLAADGTWVGSGEWQELLHGEGLAVSNKERWSISGYGPAEVLLFDLA